MWISWNFTIAHRFSFGFYEDTQLSNHLGNSEHMNGYNDNDNDYRIMIGMMKTTIMINYQSLWIQPYLLRKYLRYDLGG